MASQIVTNQEQLDLKKAFQAIDLNGDGVLTREELVQGYRMVVSDQFLAEQIVEKVMKNIDLNQSGKVDFTEFLVAAMNEEKMLTKTKIQQTFKIIDLDGDGYISKDEVEYIMGDIDLSIWNDFLKDCDDDDDGRVLILIKDFFK